MSTWAGNRFGRSDSGTGLSCWFYCGGRTRSRPLDPLIKSRMISLQDQRPLRQMFHPSCIADAIDLPLFGMMGLGQQRHERTSIPGLMQVATVQCEVGL